MKSALNLSLFLFFFLTFAHKSFSLTNYQIKIFCKAEKRQSTCIKNLTEKRSNLQKGVLIEIPVKPYKKLQKKRYDLQKGNFFEIPVIHYKR